MAKCLISLSIHVAVNKRKDVRDWHWRICRDTEGSVQAFPSSHYQDNGLNMLALQAEDAY